MSDVRITGAVAVDGMDDLPRVLTRMLHDLVARVCAPAPIGVLLREPRGSEDVFATVDITMPDGRVLTGLVALGFEVGAIVAMEDAQGITLQ